MSYWAVGGWVERSAVLVFDTWFLFSLGSAYWFRLRGEPARKREWMTRAVGTVPDLTFHAAIVIALIAGLIVTFRARKPTEANAPHQSPQS